MPLPGRPFFVHNIVKGVGLEPTQEFKTYIDKEKRGEITMEEIKRYLDHKYKNNTAAKPKGGI
ncbi:MAG: hypothetical protein IJ567_03695 [Lachnospiraceae bacterium]|nr:hypothetical protein [Lachnospiraceae bacterium]